MVIVTFLCEFKDEVKVHVPIGLSSTRTKTSKHPPIREYVSRLREKCGISRDAQVTIRNRGFQHVNIETWDAEKESHLFAIVDEDASKSALEYQDNMRRSIRSNSMINQQGPAAAATASNSSSNSSATAAAGGSGPSVRAQPGVKIIDPNSRSNKGNNNNNKNSSSTMQVLEDETENQDHHGLNDSDSDDDDDDEVMGGDHLDANGGIHFISHGPKNLPTAVSKVAAEYGKVICHEEAQISPMYPSSLVDLVRRDDRLKVWPELIDVKKNNARIEKFETSPLPQISPEEYSKVLYCAKRRGHTIPCTNDEEAEVAFYTCIDAVPHSCAPSSAVRFRRIVKQISAEEKEKKQKEEKNKNKSTASASAATAAAGGGSGEEEEEQQQQEEENNKEPTKYSAILRCIRLDGVTGGDKLSLALNRCSTMDFFLLPTSRRRRVLQEQYGLVDPGCVCDRCMGTISEAAAAIEATLTGAYFKVEVANYRQEALTDVMKKEFSELGIMQKTGTGKKAPEPLLMSKEARNGKISQESVKKVYNFLKKYSHKLPVLHHIGKTKEEIQEEKKKQEEENNRKEQEKEVQQQQQQEEEEEEAKPKMNEKKEPSLHMHPNHWRLSFCRIALFAYLFPPSSPSVSGILSNSNTKVNKIVPTKHSSVHIDPFIAAHCLAQLDVESAVFVKSGARVGHPHLARSYIVFRCMLAALPEGLSADIQKHARVLENVDWPTIERVAAGY